MSVVASPKLTNRQRDVLERVDRRVPIKVIAADLGLSEARINQHIRTLKDKFQCENMSELVDRYRAVSSTKTKTKSNFDAAGPRFENPYSKSLYRKSQLPDDPIFPDQEHRVGPGKIAFSDVHHVLIDASRDKPREPVVVPHIMDGRYAVLSRLGAMLGIAFGVVAAVILVVAAAVTVSEVLDGKASLNTEMNDP
ncbi:helix-turn-helix transcriptional regulator [Pontixanthobacter sp.]|uniref:helix-turn-helix transcriptional regulator n=1 Tax=Pontixanthobacter sp. TaxID=2792078 RepID=UPI003C7E42BC